MLSISMGVSKRSALGPPKPSVAAMDAPSEASRKPPSKISTASRITGLSASRATTRLGGATLHDARVEVATLRPGEYCEAADEVTVELSCDAGLREVVPEGTSMEVLAVAGGAVTVGIGRPSADRLVGVVVGNPTVSTYDEVMLASMDFDPGYELTCRHNPVTLRATENFHSAKSIDLKAGDKVTILAQGARSLRRVRVGAGDMHGWISSMAWTKALLIGDAVQEDKDDKKLRHQGWLIVKSAILGRVDSLKALLSEDAATAPKAPQKKLGVLDWLSGAGGAPAGSTLGANWRDARGRTALMYAAAAGQKVVVEYLLARQDTDVGVVDDCLRSALHHAVKPARRSPGMPSSYTSDVWAEVVSVLLEARASIDCQDARGRTPLMLAAATGDDVSAARLREKGASLELRDRESKCASDYAVAHGHAATVAVLRPYGPAVEEESSVAADEVAATSTGDVAVDLMAPSSSKPPSENSTAPPDDAEEVVGSAPSKPRKKPTKSRSDSEVKTAAARVKKADTAQVARETQGLQDKASKGSAAMAATKTEPSREKLQRGAKKALSTSKIANGSKLAKAQTMR